MVVLSLTATNSLADCPPAVRLKVGATVTDCDRVGLSDAADLQVRKDLVEGDFNKKIISEQKRQIELKDLLIVDITAQKTLWQTDALRERKYADSQRDNASRNLWLGIGVGIGLTVLSAWAMGQVAPR